MGKEIRINQKGGLVTAPILYLKNVRGIEESSLELEKRVSIDIVGKALCEHFDNHSNCTLVGAFNLLSFYRDAEGYVNIPSDQQELYNVIRSVADRYGYIYEKEKGIPVYYNRRFLKAVLKAFGYTGVKVSASYLMPVKKALRLLDKGIPWLLSLAYGVYYDHTVTVYGYETYRDVKSGKRYTFLLVNDEWAPEKRYIPWVHMDRFKLICVTRIK